jgi:pyrroline-5-carboxylate reductase
MQLGMIGLGRMGANMVRRLLKGGHQCVVFNRSPKPVVDLQGLFSLTRELPAGIRRPCGFVYAPRPDDFRDACSVQR